MSERSKSSRAAGSVGQRSGSGEKLRGSRVKSVVGFLNTPFGLWFLSTVFISVGSYSFTEWRESRATFNSRQEKISRLDLEITNRLDQGDLLMQREALSDPETGQYRRDALVAVPARVLLSPERSQQLFPEYASRGLRALLVELHALLGGAEALCLERALVEQRQIQLRWLPSPPRPEQAAQFQKQLDQVSDRRWSLRARQARLAAGSDALIEVESGPAKPYCEEAEVPEG